MKPKNQDKNCSQGIINTQFVDHHLLATVDLFHANPLRLFPGPNI